MLILEDGHGGVRATMPRLADRWAAFTRTDRLDVDLAHGVSPDANARLSLRAQKLTATSTRHALAQAARRLAAGALDVRPGLVVANRASVAAVADELSRLADRLDDSGPVSPRGVARTAAVLSAAWGPSYAGGSRTRLRSDLQDAVAALDLGRAQA